MAEAAQKHDDPRWLSRLCQGDEDAFAEFVEKHQLSVFLCCQSLGLNQTETEDAASETFLAAYKGLKKYSGRAKLSTWLWRIAYRQAVNYLRKNKRLAELRIACEEQIIDGKRQDGSETIQDQENAEIVWKAVGRLPKVWSIAVVLFYREGKSIAEIAKIMGRRKNTVKTYLYRSRERLREKLCPMFGDSADEG